MLFALSASFIAKQLGFEPADLSSVSDPRGRVDYLASKLIERQVEQLPADLQATYNAARPLIDGYLLANLGKIRLKVPEVEKAI